MEAQIVDIADEIAYDNHDLDDGLASGLIREEELDALELWSKTKDALKRQYPGVTNPVLRYQIIRRLIALFVDDVIHESQERIARWKIRDVEDVRRASGKVISFSKGLSEQRRSMRDFLKRGLYHHYRVNRMSYKAQRFIEALFKAYVHNTAMLPECFQEKISRKTSKFTVVCDYIASMTDRYALDEHKKLFNPYEKV
jgi:dGTPase